MKHASLFTGIGGFDLAARMMGWDNVFAVEKDPYCQALTNKNFPNTAIFGDITGFYGEQYAGTIDVISGGFPCQPFSVAGQRRGESDDRYLWDEMLRVIAEIRPRVVVGENVTGIIGMALDKVCADLENQGYEVEVFVLPACAVGALHQRNRVWIVAHSLRSRCHAAKNNWRQFVCNIYGLGEASQQAGRHEQCGACKSGVFRGGARVDTYAHSKWQLQPQRLIQKRRRRAGDICKKISYNGVAAYSNRIRSTPRLEGGGTKQSDAHGSAWRIDSQQWNVEPPVGRVAHGIPNRVDRLRALGNAVVPQLVYQIFQAIVKSGLL